MQFRKTAALLLAALSACVLLAGCEHIEGRSLTEEEIYSSFPADEEPERIESIDSVKYAVYKDHAAAIGFDGVFSRAEYSYLSLIQDKPLTEIRNDSGFIPKSLKTVYIPEGVTTIAGGAFKNAGELASITIPKTVAYIGKDAFTGTKWLAQQQNTKQLIIVNSLLIDGSAVTGSKSLIDRSEEPGIIRIPSGVTCICDNAFRGSPRITSVSIPGSVIRIGENAFQGCKNLETVAFKSGSSLREIDAGAFKDTSITAITLPGKLRSIGDEAFSSCGFLASVELPGSLTTIGAQAFYSCSSLAEIEIPARVSEIGDKAFFYCRDLKSATVFSKDCEFDGESMFSVSTDLVLYGPKDSSVQAYADTHRISFEGY